MWFQIAFTIVAVLSSHSLAAFLLGYTSESCDDLKPHRIPFVQDVVGQPGLGSNGLPINAPGFNRPNPNGPAINGPDGMNVQPILMTTVTPYRIFTVDNRYKKGRALEGTLF